MNTDAATGEWPAEARRLLVRDPEFGVPIPAYHGRSLPNLMSSVGAALGRDVADGGLPPLEPLTDPFGGRRAEGRVVVFVVDGLGYDALRRAAREDGMDSAARWSEIARPVTTVFPTTTTAALTSLGTASAPSQHGVVGHRQYLPARDEVVEILRMSRLGAGADNELVGPAWTPSEISGRPTVFRRGLSAATIARDRFEGTGFNRMVYDGATYVPHATFAELGFELARLLADDAGPPLLLAYWDELDTIQHFHGPSPEAVRFEVGRLGALLEWVARTVPDRLRRSTTVIVTADHGLVPVEPAAQLEVERDPDLLALLATPPAGDRRAAFFRSRPGRTDALRRALADRLGSDSLVVDAERAVGAGWFGPPPHHPELLARIGDVIVLPPEPRGVGYRPAGTGVGRRPHRGAHGGLDPRELVVPMVAAPLVEFATP